MGNFLEALTSPQAWLGALAIFAVRVVSIAMDTLRFMLTIRGNKTISWILGFIQSTVYVVIIGVILTNMENVLNIVAYSAGFATGNLVGMWIEQKLAFGFSHISIVSKQQGFALAEALRMGDYAVTEIPARGRDGIVYLLNLTTRRKMVPEVEKLVRSIDPEAFITTEDITPVRAGYWGRDSLRQ
ncbi:MAG: DUF2179 domain-containing protein [Chloroflexi bacterium]|nr:DUF2179 domain-containing protein [Chloroflexota bacterium]